MKGTLLAKRESTVAMLGPGPKSFFARPVCEAQVWHWWKYINCAKEPSALPHVIQWLIDGFSCFLTMLGNPKITTWKLWRMPNKDRFLQQPDYPPAKYRIVCAAPNLKPHGGIQKTRSVPSGSCNAAFLVPRLPASPSEIWSYHCGAETWNLLDSWPELDSCKPVKKHMGNSTLDDTCGNL